MKKIALIICIGLILFAFTAPAQAVPVIDQNQSNSPVYMAAFSQGDLAQSFQQASDNIAGAGIFLQPGAGTTDNVTISVWSALPNDSGIMMTSGSTSGTQGNWVDVFWTPIPLTPGLTMFLVFSGNTTLGIAGDTSNPYPYGQVYANSGYGSFLTYDYTFRTYAESFAVPEPATMLLLGLGLPGLLGLRRKFNK